MAMGVRLDSPKCPQCIGRGQIAQTYHITGSIFFKCGTCGSFFDKAVFNDIDFQWAVDEKEWRKAHGLGENVDLTDGTKFKIKIKDKKKGKK